MDLIWVSHKPPLRVSTHRKVLPGPECSQPSAGHLGNFRCCHSWSNVTPGEMVALGQHGKAHWTWLQTALASDPSSVICCVIRGKTFCFHRLHL